MNDIPSTWEPGHIAIKLKICVLECDMEAKPRLRVLSSESGAGNELSPRRRGCQMFSGPVLGS